MVSNRCKALWLFSKLNSVPSRRYLKWSMVLLMAKDTPAALLSMVLPQDWFPADTSHWPFLFSITLRSHSTNTSAWGMSLGVEGHTKV